MYYLAYGTFRAPVTVALSRLIMTPRGSILSGEHLRFSGPVSSSLLALNTQGQEVVGTSHLMAAP